MPERNDFEINREVDKENRVTDREQVILSTMERADRIADMFKQEFGLPVGVELDDLVSIGREALVRAVDEYGLDKASRNMGPFYRFAEAKIREAIIEQIGDHIEKMTFDDIKEEMLNDLRHKLGRDPERNEVIEAIKKLNLEKESLIKLRRSALTNTQDVQLDNLSIKQKDQLIRKHQTDRESRNIPKEKLYEFFDKLKSTEKKALEMALGLNDRIYTSREIGDELGISTHEATILIKDSIRKLRRENYKFQNEQ